MQVLNNHRIKITCRIEYIIQYAKDYNSNSDLKIVVSSLDKIKTIYDDVNTFETNIIPDLKDRVTDDFTISVTKWVFNIKEDNIPETRDEINI